MSKLGNAVKLFFEGLAELFSDAFNFEEITQIDAIYYMFGVVYALWAFILIAKGVYFIGLEYRFHYPIKKGQLSW